MTNDKHAPSDQAAPELLPCPFCGIALDDAETPGSQVWGGGMSFECGKCKAEWPKLTSDIAETMAEEFEAMRWFNRRADLAAPSAPSRVDDGRPMNTDVFLGKLFEACEDLWERCEAINEWLHGDWPAALEYLEGEA